jgi:DNA-binding NtrC family response regulator
MSAPAISMEKPRARMGKPAARTVLLIEDDAMLLQHMRALLRCEGFRVFAAGNVSQAEEIWAMAHERIDVILSDNVLECDRGVDLVARFKAQQPNVEIVLCSGLPLDREIYGAKFLSKPFSASTLLAALN